MRDKKGRFIKGNTSYNKGKTFSEETKKKISLARIGIKYSKETLEKMSLAQKGRKHSEETKEKMRKSSPHLSGDDHPNWQGGKVYTGMGYVLIYKPEHPCANNHGQIREHRLIMEEAIGRYLKPEEQVHHINEIIDDNRIENLMLFPNMSEHVKYHKMLEKVS